jgi:hypothetical protein
MFLDLRHCCSRTATVQCYQVIVRYFKKALRTVCNFWCRSHLYGLTECPYTDVLT